MNSIAKGKCKMVTIYDIAKELNISPSTVSRTFSNPSLVKEKTRKRVFDKASEMGYQANMVASQLRSRTSNIIALVSLQKEWSWFTDSLANGLQDEVWNAGYEVVMLNMNKEHMESLSVCEKMRFAGIVVASTELGTDCAYSTDVLPVIYVNRLVEGIYRVLPDDRFNVGCAMDYFKKMGHSRIGFINGPKNSLHSEIRYETFVNKMNEYGFPIYKEWVKRGDWLRDSAYTCMKEILELPELPTAMFVANDQMCFGVYKAMMEKGLIPGKEISIIGHDNNDYSELMIPALTTVSIPLYEMGRQAGQMLLARIKGEETEKEVIVKGKMIIRDSVSYLN